MNIEKGMYVKIHIDTARWCKVIDKNDHQYQVESVPGQLYFLGWVKKEQITAVQVPVDYVGPVII